MSEFIAEAQVLITPNVAGFAATLRAQLEAAVAAAGPVVVPVAAGVATGSGAATAAITQQTVALEAQGAAAEKVRITETNAARATRLSADAEAILAKTTADVALETGRLEKARLQVHGTTRALALQEKALAAAVASGDEALITQNELLLQNARASKAAAISAEENAVAQGQASRAIAAQAASVAGLRGAALTASAPFLVATVGVIAFGKSIKEASDQTEELNKVSVVFGKNASTIEDFAKTTASSLGISEVEALRAAGVFGNLFRTLQFGTEQSADMSKTLVQLAADMASFNNADPSRVLEALRAGLVGQARPLRVLGAFLTAARVQQEALIETQKKSTQELTQANLVQARYNLILKDTVLQQGDVARTQGRLANQGRILVANLHDLEAAFGKQLLPNLEQGAQDANKLFNALNKLRDFKAHIVIEIETHLPGGENGIAAKILGFGAGFIGPGGILKANLLGLRAVGKGLDIIGLSAGKAAPDVNLAATYLDAADRAARGAALSILDASRSFDNLTHSSGQAAAALLKIQSEGGGPKAQLPAARTRLAADQAVLAQALALSPSAEGRASAVKAAREAIVKDRALINSLTGEITSAETQATNDAIQKRKQAAAARKAAAEKAAQAQLDATNAFIESFSPRRQNLTNIFSRIGPVDTTAKQIGINNAIIKADKAEIAALQARIKHLHLHGDALKAAQAEIARLHQEIFDTQTAIINEQRDQAKRLADQKQAQFDAQATHLEALLSIAETTKSTKDDAKALNAIIALDEKRIAALRKKRKKTLEEKQELDSLLVDLAQRNHALKELTGKTEDGRKEAAKFFFSQLQAQQGFASNLLGNLITGSTAGLVGNPSAAAGQAQTKEKAQTPTSPTRGQHQTTNDILLRILHALTRANRNDQAPEARHNRHVGAAIMDNDGIHGI